MKKGLYIQFPDGNVIEEQTQFDTYVATLKRIGLEKAESVASDMRFTRKGAPLISKSPFESILNNNSGFSYVEVDGFYIVKGISPDTMVTLIRHISDSLGLGITANYYPNHEPSTDSYRVLPGDSGTTIRGTARG